MRTLPLAAVCLFSAATLLAQKPFSLEQVLCNPFPESLVAAPAGGSVAWQMNARGARNIWAASPPDYRGHKITNFSDDDGQDINQLRWTPDGRSIVFVRGGDFDMGREAPNPRSNPEGVEQALWIVSLDGGNPRKLGEGHDPAISPKGDRVAFLTKGQIWWAPLDGHDNAQQGVHARGTAQSPRWSPDGSKLVFVSSRGDHAFVAVFDPAAKSLRYIDPSVDQDREPVWSPDSSQIAFIRVPASHDLFAFGPRIAAEAWSIRVADVASGSAHEVWRAAAERGSVFYPVVAEKQLLWANGRLIFPWERTGWVHLYSVPVTGGAALELTPGDFEVEHVTLSPNSREVVFSSNQSDIDRRHIWKVAVDQAPPSPVTTGEGIEWSPVLTSGNDAVAFLRSDARRPPRPAIIIGAAAPKDLGPDALPPDFPADQLVPPQAVTISAADGLHIHGQLFLRHNLPTGERRPALIFFHGGSRRQMLLGWHYMYYYSNAYAMNQYLASRGFIVLSVNYRSGTGYGLDFREAANSGARGASEFNDVLGAGLYLRNRPDVDPSRIGVWGGSYGGYLTALGLSRASDLFAAGVDFHGVHDWNVVIGNIVSGYDPQKQQEAARVAFESSPMAAVKQWRSPVLLIHGDDDRNVPFSETVTLVEALRKQGVEFEELIFPDEVHDFLTHARWLQAYHAAAEFLERHLAKGGL
jgi:dipeptidyl aminopeptidase/acylaminoacyl peptidase